MDICDVQGVDFSFLEILYSARERDASQAVGLDEIFDSGRNDDFGNQVCNFDLLNKFAVNKNVTKPIPSKATLRAPPWYWVL